MSTLSDPPDPATRSATAPLALPTLASGLVRILDGPGKGRSLAIAGDPVLLGSAPDCHLRVPDDRVSRRHLEVRLGRHGFLVRDLSSRNGTFFEDSRVGEIAVPPGAILRLGQTHVVLSAPGAQQRIEPSDRTSFGGLVGTTAPMRLAFALLERAAASAVAVLLGGETGTGKELAARALHDEGSRRGGPFEVLDCGAASPTLLASELFGHERGAFTGAAEARAGIFERAAGGTVFLDEVGELPLDLQPMLLRVTDRAEVTRLGADRAVPVDVRIVAATHRDLAEEVVARRFREDLYYRLQVLPIALPPLRARRADLPLLCARLLGELGVPDPGPIAGANLARLAAHPWPGNVRELRNALASAVALAGPRARFGDLALDPAAPATPRAEDGSFQERKGQAIARFERQFLVELMQEHGANIKRASRASGIERTQLKRLLRKHDLA